MTLPRPPISHTTPIPNTPFDYPESYYLESNQGPLPLGNGLYINPATGAFTDIEPSPYIYCVPQFSELPVTYPPYGCETEVNTAGVTDFTDAWRGCFYLTEFPCVDTSQGTTFHYSFYSCSSLVEFPTLDFSSGELLHGTWGYCSSLTFFPKLNVSSVTEFVFTWAGCYYIASFPELDVSSGTSFNGAWVRCESLTSFPILDVSSGTSFAYAWGDCVSLTTFPFLDVSSGTNFEYAWNNCISLTTFPAGMFDNCSATNFGYAWYNCALDETSVDNILVSLDTAGQSNGTVGIHGGTSSAPGTAGLSAKASLQTKGWTVLTN